MIDRILRYVSGEDVFIAYARADSLDYSRALATKLAAKGFSCYLDQWSAQPGAKPGPATVRARKRAHLLIVIGSPEAAKSSHVAEEVQEFARSQRPIVPIGRESVIQASIWASSVHGLPITPEQHDNILRADPTPFVVDRVEKSFRYQRQQSRIIRSLIIGSILLIALGVALGFAVKATSDERKIALRERKVAEDEAAQSLSIQLATQAKSAANRGNFAVALLLSVTAATTRDTYEARDAAIHLEQTTRGALSFLWPHKDSVTSIAFSPDGKLLATGGRDNTITVWDVERMRTLREPLRGHENWITNLRFSRNGKTLISTSLDKRIMLWDLSSSELTPKPLFGHKKGIISLALSLDGKKIATGSDDGEIILWDLDRRQKLEGSALRSDHEAACLAFSPDGKQLAVCSRHMEIWDLRSRRRHRVIEMDEFVHRLSYSPNGKMLAAGTGNELHSGYPEVSFFDTGNWKRLGKPLRHHKKAVMALAFSPDGNTLATGSGDLGSIGGETIMLWDVATRSPIREEFKGQTSAVLDIAFSPDGKILGSASLDGSILMWDSTGRDSAVRLDAEVSVESIAFSPDSKILATANGTRVDLWDVETRKRLGDPLVGHPENVLAIAFSPDGKTLATANGNVFYGNHPENKSILLWDMQFRKVIYGLTGFDKAVNGISFSPNGTILAAAIGDKTVRVFDVKTGRADGNPLPGHVHPVAALAFSPDGKILATGSNSILDTDDLEVEGEYVEVDDNYGEVATDQGEVIFWDLLNRQAFAPPIKEKSNGVSALAFSPDGRSLATGSVDQTIQFWDVSAQTPIGAPMKAHYNWVRSVAYSPDGRRLVSGAGDADTSDGALILWDTETRRPLGEPIRGHTSGVLSVAYSPDGSHIASGSVADGILLRRAPMTITQWVQHACKIVNRNFTELEWSEYMGTRQYRKVCPDAIGPSDAGWPF